MNFMLPGNRQFVFTSARIPMHLSRGAVDQAQCRYKKMEEGEILSQVLLGNDFAIWVHQLWVEENASLILTVPEDTLMLFYMVQGNMECMNSRKEKIMLEEGKYHWWYLSGASHWEAKFLSATYRCFHINFHEEQLRLITRAYPFFEQVRAKLENGRKGNILQNCCLITHREQSIIEEMQHHGMKGARLALLLESRTRDLLRLYMEDYEKTLQDDPSHQHLKLLLEIERFMDSNLEKRLTVEVIAQRFGLSRSWLQEISRRYHGHGIHQVVTGKRMEEAARLLLTTNKPVGEIVLLVSDLNFARFSSAFGKYFGQAPRAYRKNNGQKRKKE